MKRSAPQDHRAVFFSSFFSPSYTLSPSLSFSHLLLEVSIYPTFNSGCLGWPRVPSKEPCEQKSLVQPTRKYCVICLLTDKQALANFQRSI